MVICMLQCGNCLRRSLAKESSTCQLTIFRKIINFPIRHFVTFELLLIHIPVHLLENQNILNSCEYTVIGIVPGKRHFILDVLPHHTSFIVSLVAVIAMLLSGHYQGYPGSLFLDYVSPMPVLVYLAAMKTII